MQNTVPSIKQEPLDIAQSYKSIRAPQTPDHTDVENHMPSQINESRHIEQPESSEPEKSTPGKKRNNAQTSLFPSRNENTSTTTIHTHTQPKTKPKSTWSLGVSLGNNLIASADNRNGFSNLAPYASAEMASLPSEKNLSNSEGPVTTPYQHIMLQNINSHPKTDIKHHFPVSVGITVQKELNNRLALETGLVYTYFVRLDCRRSCILYTKPATTLFGNTVKTKLEFLKKALFQSLPIGRRNVGKMCSRRTLRTIRNEQSSAVFQRRDSAHKPIAVVRIGIGRNLFQTGVAYKPLCRAWYCLLLRRWIGHFDHS